MGFSLRRKARAAARQAALGAVGVTLIVVGVLFLTLSAYIALSLATEPVVAALILGGAYLGTGLITLAFIGPKEADQAPPRDQLTADGDTLASAFLQGMQTGTVVRRTLRA